MYILSIEPLELVEELAIRYMEAHFGPHELEAAAQAKNLCIGSWLADVSSFRGLRCRRLILGQQWSGVAESIRVGTGHLSNRSFRLPLSKHPSETFMLAAALFLGIAVLHYWTRRTDPVVG